MVSFSTGKPSPVDAKQTHRRIHSVFQTLKTYLTNTLRTWKRGKVHVNTRTNMSVYGPSRENADITTRAPGGKKARALMRSPGCSVPGGNAHAPSDTLLLRVRVRPCAARTACACVCDGGAWRVQRCCCCPVDASATSAVLCTRTASNLSRRFFQLAHCHINVGAAFTICRRCCCCCRRLTRDIDKTSDRGVRLHVSRSYILVLAA